MRFLSMFISATLLCCAATRTALADPQPLASQEMLAVNGEYLADHANDDPQCETNPADPYEIGARATGGFDKGRCLATSLYRPVVVLNDDAMRNYGFEPSPDHIVIANVRHSDGFYVARIPLKATGVALYETVIFALVPVLEGSHAQVRMTFSEPVVLRSQDPSQPQTTKTLSNLVFSIQANGVSSDGELILHGIDGGSFSVVWCVSTLEQKVRVDVLEGKNRVRQVRLRLSAEERRRFMETFVATSQNIHYSRSFNTFARNCNTELFSVLDQLRGYTGEQLNAMNGISAKAGVIEPKRAWPALLARGFVADRSDVYLDLNQDPIAFKIARYFGIELKPRR